MGDSGVPESSESRAPVFSQTGVPSGYWGRQFSCMQPCRSKCKALGCSDHSSGTFSPGGLCHSWSMGEGKLQGEP